MIVHIDDIERVALTWFYCEYMRGTFWHTTKHAKKKFGFVQVPPVQPRNWTLQNNKQTTRIHGDYDLNQVLLQLFKR